MTKELKQWNIRMDCKDYGGGVSYEVCDSNGARIMISNPASPNLEQAKLIVESVNNVSKYKEAAEALINRFDVISKNDEEDAYVALGARHLLICDEYKAR